MSSASRAFLRGLLQADQDTRYEKHLCEWIKRESSTRETSLVRAHTDSESFARASDEEKLKRVLRVMVLNCIEDQVAGEAPDD